MGRNHHKAPWQTGGQRTVRTVVDFNPDQLFREAMEMHRQGKPAEAVACYRRLLAIQPDNPMLHYNLGTSLMLLDRPDEAATCFQQTLALKPDHRRAKNNLGNALLALNRPSEAEALYRRTLEAHPDCAETTYNLGGALMALNRLDEAEACFRRALGLNSGYAEAHNNLASVFMSQGRLPEAEAACLEAIRLKPDFVAPFYNLSGLRTFRTDDPILGQMENLAASNSLSEADTVTLCFSLAKIYEDLKNYPQALVCLNRGAVLKRKRITFNLVGETHKFRGMAVIYNRARLEALAGTGSDSLLPVFIVGMPRSGTTLVEQILSSHSQAYGAGEMEDLDLIVREVARASGKTSSFPGYLEEFGPAEYRAIGERYLARLQDKAGSGIVRVINKLPSNFLYLGLIRLALPQARIIHCRRNPVDTCLSCYSTLFARGQEFSYSMEELGAYYRLYEGLMAHWRQALSGEGFLEVDYEEVVADLEGNARRLVAYCGLDWEEGCLRFYENRRTVSTASFIQVRQPIYTSSVERGRRYGAGLQPLLAALGMEQGESAAAVPGLPCHAEPEAEPSVAQLFTAALEFHSKGKFSEAESRYRQILRIRPDHCAALGNMGALALQTGHAKEALELLQRALSIKPDYVEAYDNIGTALMVLGRLPAAETSFRRALAVKPDHAGAHVNLGTALKGMGRLSEAEQSYRRALELAPDSVQAHYNLATVLKELGRLPEVETSCCRALALQPYHAEAQYCLATVLMAMGRMSEAETFCLEAIRRNPDFAKHYHNLSCMHTFSQNDPILVQMEGLLAAIDSRQSPEEAVALCYALAKAHEDLRNYDRVLAYLNRGAALKRESISFSLAEEANKLRRLIAVYDRGRLDSLAGSGANSELPVFIVGMPRSGTTLVEQILSGHSLVHGAGEIKDLEKAVREVVEADGNGRQILEALAEFGPAEYRAVGERYLARLQDKTDPGITRVINKLPSNFLYLGLIRLALPQARIIHCRRNPVDTCLSCYSILFANGQEFSYSMEELGAYYRLYEGLMAYWRQVLPADSFLEVDYEEVVADLEGNARRLVAYCGLEWEEGCLRFYENKRAVSTASLGQVRKPIYRSSVERWRRYGSGLKPLLTALGMAQGEEPPAATAPGMPEPSVEQLFAVALEFHSKGQFSEAESRYRQILQIHPGHCATLGNMGALALQTGRQEAALAFLDRVLEVQPDFVVAHNNRGNALKELGRLTEAEFSYRRALELKPDFAMAENNLGSTLLALGRLAEAEECFLRALALQPDYVEAQYNLGNTFLADGRLTEAEACFRRVLTFKPDFAEAHNNLGSVLVGQGRLPEAEAAYLEAIRLKPDFTAPFHNLAGLRTFQADDPLVARMENLLASGRLKEAGAVPLLFSLGKAYGDLKEYDRSLTYLNQGAALKRRSITYSHSEEERKLHRLARIYDQERLEFLAGSGPNSEVPVFIVGMPRSGTTLVEQILSSHSQVCGAGETKDLEQSVRQVLHDMGKDCSFPEAMQELGSAEYRAIGERYLAGMVALSNKGGPGILRVINKLPSNFLYLGLIRLALPQARIIHCRRNPVDTCLSCYSKLFTSSQEFSYSMEELGAYYRLYEEIMTHWRQAMPAGSFLEVDYEEVVADLEGNARRLVAYCGLDWEEGCLRFYENRRTVYTASHDQVRQPIYSSSVERWKCYRAGLQPLLKALGKEEALATKAVNFFQA